jgi:[acyl-carrier-protein] S-malonyltransferase
MSTSRILAMFPGQGSQRPGMAAELLARHPETAGKMFHLAESVTGLPLTRLCVDGDAEELQHTEITQPAIVATSLAVLEVLRQGGFQPHATAGHSLGEFSALTSAGVLEADAALALVQLRGELMAGVDRRTPGAMSAVIGMDIATVAELCAQAGRAGVVEVANHNDPGQTVVSGEAHAVGHLEKLARDAGAEKVVRLSVGAPFHCSLMRDIEEEFARELEQHRFSDPRIPVFSAVTGQPVRSGAEARDLLRRQLAGPVRWVDTMRRAARTFGCDRLVEIGPGRVLSGFAKRILPDTVVRSTGDPRRIDAVLRAA